MLVVYVGQLEIQTLHGWLRGLRCLVTVHELQFPGALVNTRSRIRLSLVGELTCCVRVKSSTSSMNSSWRRLVVDCACVVFLCQSMSG